MRDTLLLTLSACRAPVATPPDPVKANLDRYLDARTALGQWSGAVLVAAGEYEEAGTFVASGTS